MIYTRKMLSKYYGVSYNTFKSWLSKIDGLQISKQQRVLTPKQTEIIFQALGKPHSVNKYL